MLQEEKVVTHLQVAHRKDHCAVGVTVAYRAIWGTRTLVLMSGFRRDVDEICGLLG
jgi:hypothetical protein